MNTYIIQLTEEELEELILLTDFASCEDNLSSRLFDRLNQIRLLQSEHETN